MTFVELPSVTQRITELVDDSIYAEFQRDLLLRPDKGDVIRHAGGLRKVRLRMPGRGKRGGARVIYLHLPKHETVVLFYVYTKAQREDLSSDQLKRLREAVAVIKQQYNV